MGYRTNDPNGRVDKESRPWVVKADVNTLLAGLNFGSDGNNLVGVDLDYHPESAISDEDAERGKRMLAVIRSGLMELGMRAEISQSGKGLHFFATGAECLMSAFTKAKFKRQLVVGEIPEKGQPQLLRVWKCLAGAMHTLRCLTAGCRRLKSCRR